MTALRIPAVVARGPTRYLTCSTKGVELLTVIAVIPACIAFALVLQLGALKAILWLLASHSYQQHSSPAKTA